MTGIAAINLGLFLSTWLNVTQATLVSILLFIFCPLIAIISEVTIQSYSVQVLCFLNPPVASNLMIQIYTDLSEAKRKIPFFEDLARKHPNEPIYQNNLHNNNYRYQLLSFQWHVAVGCIFASGVLYLFLYLFFERDRDVDKKRMEKYEGREGEAEISMIVMNEAPGRNFEEVLLIPEKEKRRKKDVNSALYKEELLKGDDSKKTIRVEGLRKVYGEHTVLDDVSFTIYEQEIFCLLGHNGAGKTTLVNILTGLVSLTEGTFYYNENEMFSNMSRLQESIGFCAQHDFALENNTVYENLEFFAEIKKVPKALVKTEIQRVLEKFNLGKFEHMQAGQLSDGWRRKLNIAIALLSNPNIIIMDEPTSGMDPVTRREYWEIIQKLKQDKKTVVITTQFLDEAEKLCDRLAILSKGRLFAVGSVDFIKKKFGTGYNLIVESSNNKVDKLEDKAFKITTTIHSIAPQASRHDDFAGSILKYLLPFSEQNKFPELFSELEKIPGIRVSLQLISLEEAFVKLELNSDRIIGKNNFNDEFKARLHNIPDSFYQEKTGSFSDHIKAILLQRYHSFKADSKEKGTLFASMIIFTAASGSTLLASSLLLPVFIASVCTDRTKRIRYLLKVQGVKPFAYWSARFIGDFIVQLPLMILVVLLFSMDPKIVTNSQIYEFILLYVAFYVSLITFSFNLSLKLKSPQLSWVGGPVTILGGLVLAALACDVIEMSGLEIYRYAYLFSGFFFGPASTFFLGNSRILNPLDKIGKGTAYAFETPWPYSLTLLLIAIIDFLLVVYRDSKVVEPMLRKGKAEKRKIPVKVDEKALTAELQRLISRNNQDAIKVQELQKTYQNGCGALEGLDFGVEKDQIFCLLGANGAGKTTCLDILTNDLTETSGTIEIEGQDLKDFYAAGSRKVGVCCQTNTLWKELTVRQHLLIFSQINGIEGLEANQTIQYLLDSLQLEGYSQQKVGQLSMGIQRKLCVALSVIGAPGILFFDEPSTGVDPVGRNQIWDLIKTVIRAKQGSMILTTHYMQEAELVGDKLGILINGAFQTIETLANLKKKHGDYLIVIKVTKGKARINKAVEFVFPDAVIDNSASKVNELVFKVPAEAMKFSKIFEVLAASKAEGEIDDFSIYTTTLEQIFVRLVKDSLEEEPEDESKFMQHKHKDIIEFVEEAEDESYLQSGEYNVEGILDMEVRFGKKFYLIKWQGYPHSQNTWEPIENLAKVVSMVEKFEEDYARGMSLINMAEENPGYFPKEEEEFSLGKPRKKRKLNVENDDEEEIMAQPESRFYLDDDEEIQEISTIKEDLAKKGPRIKQVWKPLKKIRAPEESDSSFEIPIMRGKRAPKEKSEAPAMNDSLYERSREKKPTRGSGAEYKKPQKKARKAAAKNKDVMGSFRNKDKLRAILSTKIGRGGGFDFLVEWERRYDGSKPENSMVTNEEIKIYDPYFLVDFYEAKIEIISQHRVKKAEEKAEEESVIVISETPALTLVKEKDEMYEGEIEQPRSERTKQTEVVGTHANEVEDLGNAENLIGNDIQNPERENE